MPIKQIGTTKFYTDTTSRSWDQCQTQADAYGLEFASIHNNAERDAINAYTTSQMWAGGQRVGNTNTWEWVDGTPWNYAPWHPQQPDNIWETGLIINWIGTNTWNDLNKSAPKLCLFAMGVSRSTQSL